MTSTLLRTALAALFLLSACAPAAPSPAAPAKPTEAPKPAAPPAAPAAASPAASPAPSPSPSPAAAAAAPAASGAAAKPSFNEQAVADFYRGKTVRMVVGFAAGGGFDTYARLIGQYLGKYIPGNPTVVVDNMPGAASGIAMNFVYNSAPKDGTTIGSVSGGIFVQALFGNSAMQFDATKARYLGVPITTGFYVALVSSKLGMTKLDDIFPPTNKQLVLGGEAPGIGTHDGAVLMKEVLGGNIKLVDGYQGTAPLRKALDQGEIDGFLNGWDSAKLTQLDQIKSGELLPLVVWREEPSPELPNVPTIVSYAKTDEQRQLLRYGVILPNVISRIYVVAPEVPDDRYRALEAAYASTLADKDFLADAAKGRLEISPLNGDGTRKVVEDLFAMPPAVKTRLQQLIGG